MPDDGSRRSPKQMPAGARHDLAGTFALLLAGSPLPMWVFDVETLRFLDVNEAAVVDYGYTRDEYLAMTIEQVQPEHERAALRERVAGRGSVLQRSGSWRHRRSDGVLLDVEVSSHLIDWDGRLAALVVAHDVTSYRRLEAELSRRVLYDEGTGLANTTLFTERTATALARAARGRAQVGVVVIGLDGLEMLAASAGDEAVDAVVRTTTERLRACCGAVEMLARLGGGRFALVCESSDEHAILALAASVTAALARPFTLPGGREHSSTAAVGVALADGGDASSLVRDASSAMRHAAERGGGHFIVSNSELRRHALEAFEIEQALGQAIRLGELYLCYQPLVDLEALDVVGCEALLRWDRAGHRSVGPDRFIPLAERSSLIVELGAWVIEHAIAEAASWRREAHGNARVGVNLSARQLHDVHLVERFASACAASELPATSVCVELTESAFVATDDYDAYRVLAALRETGVEVAIDDFGTGYSSLAYVKHLPVDVVKIDRGFIAGLDVDRADRLLVEAMIHVAHGLGMRVVAEGVETRSQLEVVHELGCDAAQGYLLSRPVRGEDLASAVTTARQAVAGHDGPETA
ncbi:MAG: EAL domain-containing protein [Actinomycetota bacterium]|nr:EAL domain-containing protein [Actinomycetota bacterium]